MRNEESKLSDLLREFAFCAECTSSRNKTQAPSAHCGRSVRVVAGLLAVLLVAASVRAHGATAPPKRDPDGIRPSYQTCLDKTGGVTPSMQDCISAEHEYQDKRLNLAYKTLIDGLDSNGRSSLRAEERKWIAQRDRSCKRPTADDGQAQELMYRDCLLTRTAKRATALESRVR